VLVLGHATNTVGPLLAAIAMLGALRGQPTPLPPDHVGRLPLPLTRVEARVANEPITWAPDRMRVTLDVQRGDGIARTGMISLALYGPPPPGGRPERSHLTVRANSAVNGPQAAGAGCAGCWSSGLH
jgi:hypothetical protein